MGVKIRLSRHGAKKRPYYRIVVADIRAPRDGKFLEKVGTFNPLKDKSDDSRLKLDLDRIKHWLGNGAQPTNTVHKFLSDAGVLKPVKRNNPNKAKPKKNAQERLKAKEELLKKKQEETEQRRNGSIKKEAAPARRNQQQRTLLRRNQQKQRKLLLRRTNKQRSCLLRETWKQKKLLLLRNKEQKKAHAPAEKSTK